MSLLPTFFARITVTANWICNQAFGVVDQDRQHGHLHNAQTRHTYSLVWQIGAMLIRPFSLMGTLASQLPTNGLVRQLINHIHFEMHNFCLLLSSTQCARPLLTTIESASKRFRDSSCCSEKNCSAAKYQLPLGIAFQSANEPLLTRGLARTSIKCWVVLVWYICN